MNSSLAPKTRIQIASEYDIDYKTLMRRLKKQDVKLKSGLIYPICQKKIYDVLGYPSSATKTAFEGF